MAPQEYAPAPLLANFVQAYWITQRNFRPPKDTFQVIPDRFIEVIFIHGASGFLRMPNADLPMPALYLVHLLEQPFTLRFEGTVTIVAARLYAWALELLLPNPTPPPDLPITSLQAYLPQLGPQLAACLALNQPQQAVQCLETALLQQFQLRLPLQQRRARLLNQLLNQVPFPSPAALADAFALSVRQVERLVKTASGTTAKLLTRLARFETARNQLWQQPDLNLTQLAYELGYADQAHFSRDFKAFSGQSPRAFVAQVRQWQA